MKQLEIPREETVFPYSGWIAQVGALRERYYQAQPFPHIVLENFLQAPVLEQALSEFPAVEAGDWINYIHVNERKYGKTDLSSFGPTLQSIVKELNSKAFVKFLSDLTGIEGLFADESLEGGGLHQCGPGGFLNIHADFTVHPHHQDWRRRVNVLVYLNKNWRDEYGGHLELWDKKMERCFEKIAPLFNRAVIFNTDPDAFHGHPDPIQCPAGESRKSIALYYFTRETKPYLRSTEYRSRPQDPLGKKIEIFADKWILRLYDRFKRLTGQRDDFASDVLKWIDRLREKLRLEKK